MSVFDPSGAGLAGAVLAVVAIGPRAARARGREFPVLFAVAAGAVAATSSGHAGVLVTAWLVVAVGVRALDEGDGRVAAFAFLGDAVAIAAFAALGVDQGTGALPWAGGPEAQPWMLGMVAAGLGLRVAVGAGASPVPLVVGLTVAVRLSGSLPPDVEWLLAAGVLAVVAPWLRRPTAPGHVAALTLLGFAAWGPDHAAATGVATTLLAAAALVAVAREAGVDGAVRRVSATGLAAVAAVGASALPLGGRPAAAGLASAAFLVTATLATVPPPPPFRAPGGGRLLAPAGASLLAAAAATALLVPEAWWAAVGPPDGADVVGDSLREALLRGRSGLAASLGFAAAVTAGVAMGRRRRTARA